jgi:signal peptidase II
MSIFKKALLLVIVLLAVDQVIKVWIKTNMMLGDEFIIFGDWAKIHFTENPGMAFGFIFGGKTGKLILSIFRLIAIAGLIWYMVVISKQKYPKMAIISIALVLTGALGNMFDSAFYGILFSESTYHSVAEFLPEQGGYAGFLHGSVVDMFYFPMFEGTYPSWSPIKAGEPFIFFSPVFNFADSCIFIGVVLIIIFRKKFLKTEPSEES